LNESLVEMDMDSSLGRWLPPKRKNSMQRFSVMEVPRVVYWSWCRASAISRVSKPKRDQRAEFAEMRGRSGGWQEREKEREDIKDGPLVTQQSLSS
jgi:hypothetical protein